MFSDQQADYIKQIRDGGPTADFTQGRHGEDDTPYLKNLVQLAQADAMVYFQDQKDSDKDSDFDASDRIGLAHAFRHHLIGDDADTYKVYFSAALDALALKD